MTSLKISAIVPGGDHLYMSHQDNKSTFLSLLEQSLQDSSFIKATLSRPPTDYRWSRVAITAFINSKGTPEISFEYSDKRQVIRSNIAVTDAFAELLPLLNGVFRSAYLKTKAEEISFEHTLQDTYRLKRRSLTEKPPALPSHNRGKNYIIPETAPFLTEVGIVSKAGMVKADRYDKFKQIQKFIEIISTLVPAHALRSADGFKAVDFGSGKHYLTFALHHFLTSHSERSSVLGVEQRSELVNQGLEITKRLALDNISFVPSPISAFTGNEADLVVALHACDTATDDALTKAIEMNARYICVAPCCHRYVRQHFKHSSDLEPILRHGILAERFADSLTDSLRVLLLESLGYETKLFEFISPDHTAKNIIITAALRGQPSEKLKGLAATEMQELYAKFNLRSHYPVSC